MPPSQSENRCRSESIYHNIRKGGGQSTMGLSDAVVKCPPPQTPQFTLTGGRAGAIHYRALRICSEMPLPPFSIPHSLKKCGYGANPPQVIQSLVKCPPNNPKIGVYQKVSTIILERDCGWEGGSTTGLGDTVVKCPPFPASITGGGGNPPQDI